MKGSKKVWEDFIQWLRTNYIATVKHVKNDCECEWFVNMSSERLYTKGNNEEHTVHTKSNENNRQSVYEHEK